MTIDEAIKHCEEVAEKLDKLAVEFKEQQDNYVRILGTTYKPDYGESEECVKQATEHRQLAAWLRELKAYKKAYTEIDSKIEIDYMGNNKYEMAVSDGYQGAINIIDRCIEEVNADEDCD